jgi:hypothetical protein
VRKIKVSKWTRSSVEICRRCITQPTDHQAILLQRLGLHLPSYGFGRLATGLPVAERKVKRIRHFGVSVDSRYGTLRRDESARRIDEPD